MEPESGKLLENLETWTERLQEDLGDRAEQVIGDVIAGTRLDAEEIRVEPGQAAPELELRKWYRIPVEGGCTADGSDYHIYIRSGNSRSLCVFLSGGGIAWNPYTAAHPVTGGRVFAWLPNYYWSNLRPFTQIYNIGVGITGNSEKFNPFDEWNFLIVTYATGDLHLGRTRYPYTDEAGEEQVLHFHGYENFMSAMRIGKTVFPFADRLLIAGESAGAFAVPALAEQIHQEFYPACRDVTLLSDSALLVKKHWRKTARDVWNVRPEIWKDLHGTNMTLDWYRALYKRRGEQYRYLYASSVRDYLLSAFYNDVQNKKYDTDEEMQEIFRRQLGAMIRELKKITPNFGIFLYDWKRPLLYRGGTIHTMVRQPEFYLRQHGNPSMAEWLTEAVDGHVTDVGLDLVLRRRRKKAPGEA